MSAPLWLKPTTNMELPTKEAPDSGLFPSFEGPVAQPVVRSASESTSPFSKDEVKGATSTLLAFVAVLLYTRLAQGKPINPLLLKWIGWTRKSRR